MNELKENYEMLMPDCPAFEQVIQCMSNETLELIMNDTFWAMATWANNVHIEFETSCITVYWCTHPDWANAESEEYETSVYDYDWQKVDPS